MTASAAAGLLSRLLLHPIDTVKSRMQVASNSALMLSLLTQPGLYRGFTVAAAGSIPGVTLYFTSFHVFKQSLTTSPQLVNAVDFSAGFLAEAVSCAFWVPVDVIKERMQVSNSANIQSIYKSVGLRGLYRGYWATLASYGPFSSVYFTLVEALKRREASETRSLSRSVAQCGLAGAIAAFVTTPLDLVKLRLQVPNFQYKNFTSGLVQVARTEGMAGLYRGAVPRVLFGTLNTAVTMGSMEFFRLKL